MQASIEDVGNWNAILPVKGKSLDFRRFDLELFQVPLQKKCAPFPERIFKSVFSKLVRLEDYSDFSPMYF